MCIYIIENKVYLVKNPGHNNQKHARSRAHLCILRMYWKCVFPPPEDRSYTLLFYKYICAKHAQKTTHMFMDNGYQHLIPRQMMGRMHSAISKSDAHNVDLALTHYLRERAGANRYFLFFLTSWQATSVMSAKQQFDEVDEPRSVLPAKNCFWIKHARNGHKPMLRSSTSGLSVQRPPRIFELFVRYY